MTLINKTFRSCIILGAFIAFDEATFSSRSNYLPGRQYNPMKPAKFGLKLFMLCCAVIGYCHSFELYQGKKRPNNNDEQTEIATAGDDDKDEAPVTRLDDTMTGPAALLRNCSWMHGSHRTVFCDRFYTTVNLFVKLKSLGINAVGTIMSNRKGFSNLVKFSSAEANSLERGSLKMAKAIIEGTNDSILSLGWLDTKPVYLIAVGIASAGDHVVRRLRGGVTKVLTGCRPLTLYHKYMGGVDTHDYMRMGSYSLQKSYHMKYWPKTMFLAMLDLVLVNMYIMWKLVHLGKPTMKSREEFYSTMAQEMFFYDGFDAIVRTRSSVKSKTPSPAVKTSAKSNPSGDRDLRSSEYTGHTFATYLPRPRKTRSSAKRTDDYLYGNGGRDSKYRFCFVCARLAVGRHQTNLYCECCLVPVCSTSFLRHDKEGEPYLCWNELHDNPKLQRAVAKSMIDLAA